MMATKKSPGRPPKPPEQKPEQFSIRLLPKVKFALELLAKAHDRSLSQSVDWAVQRGLNSVRIRGYEHFFDNEFPGLVNDLEQPENLAELAEYLWTMESRWKRLSSIYYLAPELLNFSETSFCETIVYSKDLKWHKLLSESASADSGGPSRGEYLEQVNNALTTFVDGNWDSIVRAVELRDLQGKTTRDAYLGSLLEPGYKLDLGIDDLLDFHGSRQRDRDRATARFREKNKK